MYFAVLEKRGDEEVLHDYLSALTIQGAREAAVAKYGPTAYVELVDDEEVFAEYDRDLDDWASIQNNGKGEPEAQAVKQAEEDLQAKPLSRTDRDRDVREILNRTRSKWQPVTTKELHSVTETQTLCIDCGKSLPYTTRPHQRCPICQKKHRRDRDRERKRLARQ